MKKIILFGCIFLLILTSLTQISSSNMISGNNIIYVDDDGGADYTRIQDAIDNASDGDTVFVYGGIYYETLVFNKSIKLKGENKDSTFIDGRYILNHSYAITLTGYSKRFKPLITGFTIQNFDLAIAKRAPMGGSLNINISDNIITNNSCGISLPTTIGGLHVGLEITNNIIVNNSCGVYLSCFKNILIKRNYITSNSRYGITLDRGINIRIIQNNIFNNTIDGFVNSYGYLGMFYSVFLNRWSRNYWRGDYQIIQVIPGDPCNVYDFHPAKEPYDI